MHTWLEMPEDVVLDVSRLVLVGNLQLLVENHRGLAEFSAGRVVIFVPRGRLIVQGEDLIIGRISQDAITLLGRISGLSLDD